MVSFSVVLDTELNEENKSTVYIRTLFVWCQIVYSYILSMIQLCSATSLIPSAYTSALGLLVPFTRCSSLGDGAFPCHGCGKSLDLCRRPSRTFLHLSPSVGNSRLFCLGRRSIWSGVAVLDNPCASSLSNCNDALL